MEFVAYLVNFFILRRLIEGSGIKIIGSESQSIFNFKATFDSDVFVSY